MIQKTVSKKLSKKRHIYGPVPSRRLGYSLGIDTIPFKTCPFNCIYCQLGKTTLQTERRKRYIPANEIFAELKNFLKNKIHIDHITFSGSGEPTLNREIGNLIKKIKKITDIPIAVITDSSLLYKPEVRKALLSADVVLPTLTTAKNKTFKLIHRPLSHITIKRIIDGLAKFRKIYKGEIWLEVMMLKGINDTEEELKGLKTAIDRIKPDRIQLNTVVRPPSEYSARPLGLQELRRIKKFFGENCEIVAEFRKQKNILNFNRKGQIILQYLKRRPATAMDMSRSLGISNKTLLKYLSQLLKSKKIKRINYQGKEFYEAI